MRVGELIAQRTIRVTGSEIPEPAPGEVQVRVTAVGICGSDMHSYAEGAVGDTPCVYPMVLGHEPAGVVVKAGAGVTGWTSGARAAFEPAIYCYHCEFCHSGRHNLCANLRFLSMPSDPGFFRDYVNLPAQNLTPLPPGMDLKYATMIEPMAVVLHSLQRAAPAAGETAVVFGAGPIGALTVAALKLTGAKRVWAVEPLAHRREMALRLGADVALDPADGDPVRAIWKDSGNRGVDLAIDCATKGGTINQAIGVVRNGGRVVYTGIPSEVQAPIDFHPMRRKELVLYNVRRSNHESELALDLLHEHTARFAPLITHEKPLEEIQEAFNLVEHYRDGVGKLVVTLT